MKNFILTINKYKKWVVLGLSILMLFLFLFPFQNYAYDNYKKLPFVLALPISLINLINEQYFEVYPLNVANALHTVKLESATLICCLIVLCLINIALLITTIVITQKNKSFLFLPSLCLALVTRIVEGIKINFAQNSHYYSLRFSFVFYILIILLILDIVYLVLERKYLKENKQEPEEVVKTF